ncbi:F-box/LRR-repeat protein 15-like [Phlebotomus papatasi]|uniref:F-box/LRR-repeat protein 15-like n=1 Tax=Phlebotomus papatasi TaxID=29031 RepID=UPI002483E811|nr:F-box/LRR-repeat protein 15-like [Phlebotomus papatasi]
MASASPKTLFDLPLEDILVDNVGKYLDLGDIYRFGKCSKVCKVLADSMAATKTEFILINKCATYNILETQFSDFISYIVEKCRQLKYITIFTYVWTYKNFLIELLKNNPQVEIFCALNCENQKHKDALPLVQLTTQKKLKNLVLMRFNLDDNFLIKLSENNNQLREVNFSHCTGFSEDALLKFLEKQPHLGYIDLTSCDITDSDSLLSVIRNTCSKLEILEITGIKGVTKDDISKIKENCPKIKIIDYDPFDSENENDSLSDISMSDQYDDTSMSDQDEDI